MDTHILPSSFASFLISAPAHVPVSYAERLSVSAQLSSYLQMTPQVTNLYAQLNQAGFWSVSEVKPTQSTYPQGTVLRAKQDFSFRNPKSNRINQVKAGSVYWVSNSQVNQKSVQAACISKHTIGSGFLLSLPLVSSYFDIIN